MKIYAIVVTYYPDKEDAVRNCMAYIDNVDRLIVWENTPEPDRMKYRLEFDDGYSDKVLFMGDEKNRCIAWALNRAVESARENGCTHLLSMDQDSLFEAGAFEKYLKLVERHKNDKTIGIFGVNPNNIFPDTDVPLEVTDAITSGSIYNMVLFDHVSSFREDFGIDGVDYDMSYKANDKGFRTVVFGSIHMQQCYGEPMRTRYGFSIDNYSAFRLYHIVRNHTIMWREYPRLFPYKKQLVRNFIVLRIVKVMLAEKDKRKKIAAILTGLRDGLLGRTNKYQ